MTVPRKDTTIAVRVKNVEDELRRIKLAATVTQSAVQPSAVVKSSVWYDSSTGNKPLVFDGTAWVPVRDETIAVAQATADTAQVTANAALAAATSDGIAPTSSPTPDPIGGIGAVNVRWTPVNNADPVTYQLYGSTVDGFTADGTTLLVETAGSSFTHRPTAPDYDATYYYKLIALDADGAAPASAQGSAQLHQVTGPDVAADYVYANTVVLDQLIGGTLSAEVLIAATMRTALAGSRVEIGPFGQVIYNSAGVPVIVFPTDGSGNKFKGDVEADGLTVLGGLALRSTMNEVSTGASVNLQSSTTATVSPPSIVVGYPNPVVSNNIVGAYGLVWTGTDFCCVADSFDSAIVRRTASADTILGTPNAGPKPWGGITRIGTNWYTLGINTANTAYVLSKYTDPGVLVVNTPYTPLAGVNGSGGAVAQQLGVAAIGTDGTNVLIAEYDSANQRYRIQTRDPSTLAITATLNTSTSASFTGPVTGVARGTFDLGVTRTIILTKNGSYFLPFDAAGTYQPNDIWATPVPGSMSGFAWDGTRFWSTRAQHIASNAWIYKHTTQTWSGTDPQTWYATCTWRDTNATGGTHETDMGPVQSFAMKKRAAVTLTSATIPAGGTDDPNAVSFYLGKVDATRTNLWRQTLPADGVNTIVTGDGITFAGTNPPATNNFPGAIPATIRNPSGTLVVSGDGSIKGSSISVGSDPVASLAAAQAVTNKDLSSLTNAFPTFPYWYGYLATSPAALASGAVVDVTTWTADGTPNSSGITHASGVFTVPTAGRYRITGQLTYPASNTTGSRVMEVFTGSTGGTILVAGASTGNAANITTAYGSRTVRLAAGATFRVIANQGSGLSLSLVAGVHWSFVQIEWVGP